MSSNRKTGFSGWADRSPITHDWLVEWVQLLDSYDLWEISEGRDTGARAAGGSRVDCTAHRPDGIEQHQSHSIQDITARSDGSNLHSRWTERESAKREMYFQEREQKIGLLFRQYSKLPFLLSNTWIVIFLLDCPIFDILNKSVVLLKLISHNSLPWAPHESITKVNCILCTASLKAERSASYLLHSTISVHFELNQNYCLQLSIHGRVPVSWFQILLFLVAETNR